MLTAVVGVNWGDEGKGRMIDLLSAGYDIVARYQGGNNAGHTVVNDFGKFVLNLIPCGIFREGIINVLGIGMVIDLEHLRDEIEGLRARGISITPENLKISEKAIICLPYHRRLDVLEEDRLGSGAQGSTRRGIAPVYSDKYHRKALRVGDVLRRDTLREKLETVAGFKDLLFSGYGEAPVSIPDTLDWLCRCGDFLAPFIENTETLLESAAASGAKIMLEAQLGTLRDIDFGIYPYTTSSTTLAAFGPIGAGIPGRRLDRVIGVVKAYSSSVGGGPFTSKWHGEEAERFRELSGEYGAATGRPRSVGPFDCVASRFGVKMQGADTLALTKFDILSHLEKIPVCVAYDVNGRRVEDFPTGDDLDAAKPIFEYLPGFSTDISKCRRADDLPRAAIDYIKFIESSVGARIEYVSVGPHRDEFLVIE
ncbi:MAG: adenylosuccinate synthase [Oscillospiraceae bacterium]|jgi:adenylosuccinate synthase|nr:adenylosuccinate synthase [Oscillospiraceae bacterium]